MTDGQDLPAGLADGPPLAEQQGEAGRLVQRQARHPLGPAQRHLHRDRAAVGMTEQVHRPRCGGERLEEVLGFGVEGAHTVSRPALARRLAEAVRGEDGDVLA